VDAWTSTYRGKFSNLPAGVQGYVSNPPSPPSIFTLPADTTTDPIRDNDLAGVHSYIPLKYQNIFTMSSMSGSIPSMEVGPYYHLTMEVTVNDVVSTVSVPRLYVAGDSREADACKRAGGFVVTGNSYSVSTQCRTLWQLATACVRVSTGSWGVRQGCVYSSNIPGDTRISPIGTYSQVTVPSLATFTLLSQTVPLAVRSDQDPWVFLQGATLGSLRFGLTRGQKVAVALALLIIGSILTAPTLLAVLYLKRKNQRPEFQHPTAYVPAPTGFNPPPPAGYAPQQQQPNGYPPQQQAYAPPIPQGANVYGAPPQPQQGWGQQQPQYPQV
jgi:hypothetical protein